MNNNILHGFCQKCDDPIILDTDNPNEKYWKAKYTSMYDLSQTGRECTIEPVWFLSPEQGQIVRGSNEFQCSAYKFELDFLEDNPFLVAKILKESENK